MVYNRNNYMTLNSISLSSEPENIKSNSYPVVGVSEILSRGAGVEKVSSGVDPATGEMEKDKDALKDEDSSNEGDEDLKDEDAKGSGKKDGGGKSRRELPAGAVATLKQWLLSPEHFTHPYPTPQDQAMLMQKTGIDKKQLKNWFTNARRRIWKPMLKKQLEQGALAPTNSGGGGVAVPGIVPGLVAPNAPSAQQTSPAPGQALDSSHAIHAMQAHFQQAMQQQNTGATSNTPNSQQYMSMSQFQASSTANPSAVAPMVTSYSIGSLPPMNTAAQTAQATPAQMQKNDSHAVLMELFARDQDLVRQAEAKKKALVDNQTPQLPQQQQQPQLPQQPVSQHPMKQMVQAAQTSRMGNNPNLNSWPHFSSVSSLNNLGTLTGVKSITSLSGADLASQGNLGKKGNLAQVKSEESMGRADSYAFLEVFFDDRSNPNVSSTWASRLSGSKREREEDNDVGLSLDADESPSNNTKQNEAPSSSFPTPAPSSAAAGPRPAPIPADGKDRAGTTNANTYDNNTLKRAYDDALAARGLISVSRSSEKLTDLALPAKMQRSLSQEVIRQQQYQSQFGSYGFTAIGNPQMQMNTQGSFHPQQQQMMQNFPPQQANAPNASQFPAQFPTQQQQQQEQFESQITSSNTAPTPLSDPSMTSDSVEVPATTKCSLCHCINVDTQLRPCGHMFHGRCLKPSLQNAMGPPTCPIDHIPMQSAVLAVPTDEHSAQSRPQLPSQQQHQTWPGGNVPTFQIPSAPTKPEATKSSRVD